MPLLYLSTEWNKEPSLPATPSYFRLLYLGRVLADEQTLSGLGFKLEPHVTIVHLSVRTFPIAEDGEPVLFLGRASSYHGRPLTHPRFWLNLAQTVTRNPCSLSVAHQHQERHRRLSLRTLPTPNHRHTRRGDMARGRTRGIAVQLRLLGKTNTVEGVVVSSCDGDSAGGVYHPHKGASSWECKLSHDDVAVAFSSVRYPV
jgi:hypothetical protein